MSMLIKGFNVANADVKLEHASAGALGRQKIALVKERIALSEQKLYAELFSKEEWCCDRATD